MHRWYELAFRQAGYEMEAMELVRIQLREATTWLNKCRGRLSALDLCSRPRGGAKAFLKKKKVELRAQSIISSASRCAKGSAALPSQKKRHRIYQEIRKWLSSSAKR